MLTWLEINSKVIKRNLKQLRRLIGPKVMLMPVIKANAYGHGFLEVAKICNQSGEVDRVCVVNLDEALTLIKNKLAKKPIMILSFYELDKKKISIAVKHGIIFPVYDVAQANFLYRVGERMDKKVKIHVKIDTGATRIGILPTQAINFIIKTSKLKNLNIEGIFSHFASSETDPVYTKKQLKLFNDILLKLEKNKIFIPIRHMACSASSTLFKTSHFNAVRLGTAMYGLYSSPKMIPHLKIKPALSWYSTIIQIKILPSDTKIGYGGTYTTKKPTKLAIIPVGYYDGYDIRLSNHSQVIIRGKKCPVRGRICMNLFMADVTALKNIKTGDRVTIIGQENKNSVSADDLAKIENTINYEIVDRINPLLPRVVL